MELPEGRKALPSHWVYKIKRDGGSNVKRFKARLVWGGDNRIEGIDYQATSAPTTHLGRIRLAFAITANTISRSIKWTSAQLCWKSTWKKRFIRTYHSDIFVWFKQGD
jgi:hypothetical protein